MLGLLLQRCQWRRWGRLRMERIAALTVIKGTRASSKRHKELLMTRNPRNASNPLSFDQHPICPSLIVCALARPRVWTEATEIGKEQVVAALAPHTRAPPCKLAIRPISLAAIPTSTTTETFNHAMRICFVRDLAEMLGVMEKRLELVATPCPAEALDTTLGLELQAAGTTTQRLQPSRLYLLSSSRLARRSSCALEPPRVDSGRV